MAAIQIKDLPEDIYKLLKERAKLDRRSLQQEAAFLLEAALKPTGTALRQHDWTLVDHVRDELRQRYGTLPDSTPLIRDMREQR